MTLALTTNRALATRRAARLYADVQARARTRTWGVGIHDPEDSAQIMTLSILTGRARHDGAAITFAHRSALDALRNEMRRQARVALELDDDGQEVRLVLEDTDVDEALDRRARLEAVKAALPEWGAPMIDLLVQGYRVEEIADQMGVTRNNVHQRLHRIRAAAARLEAE